MPADQRSGNTPVAPPTTSARASAWSMALNVSAWILESASMKQTLSPRASCAPPLRAAAIRRFSTRATSQPRAAAIAAVSSVDALSATMTCTEPR